MSDRVGQRLGNYRLLRLLGGGNFAEVYLGEHLHLGTQAAIKVLHAQLTSEDSEQFRVQVRMIARLVHPLILRILDFDVEDGIPFQVIEYAPNGTLRQRHPKGTLVPLDTIVAYVKQLAEVLHYVHGQGWSHRNVKPENMLFGRNYELLLTDFGIAITTQSSYSQQSQEMIGTVTYTAPELLQGHPFPASDQYALAVVVYEWLSGDPPFSGSVQQIASQHLSVPPPPLRTKVPTISPAIEHVVLKALAKDPELRFANVQAFATALEEAYNAESPGRTLPASAHAAASGQKSSSLRSLPTGTVTLLFTDIEGSTRLLQQLGDRYASVLSQCRHLLRSVFQEWGGHEVDTQGDGSFVAFARATDAVLAVVDAQRALASHHWPAGIAVRVRMVLHTGEPALTSEGYVGMDVHRAARLMSAGHGGQVLLSQATCTLVEQDLPDDVSIRDLGEHRLRDLGRPRRLFQLVISDLPADFPPLRTLDSHPNNLPVQPTPFIGREQEVAAVGQLLQHEDVRLVTLTGPGGTGKTRLGLQVAAELSDHFADGIFFVNLAPISDPALVIATIAETLGIREVSGQPLLERLKEQLQQKYMLLLLDNFEQVVDAASQVTNILTICPQLKVLVTSREVLHVRAEHEFAVPPLALPDPRHLPDLAALSHYAAVALFLQRAQAVKPDFRLTPSNARAIAEICVRLDGLPLAIELAAARMKLFAPQALLARLNQRLQVLTSGARDVPARQQTLRNTLTWSYNLLNVGEQQLFRRLSVFVGSCTLEAAASVCHAAHDLETNVLEEVASLLDKSLLQQAEKADGEPRLLLLETMREYGWEWLAASGELQVTRDAHARYYFGLAEQAVPHMLDAEQSHWYDRLEREYANVLVALQWAVEREGEAGEPLLEQALQLFGDLWMFWDRRSHERDVLHFLEQALAKDVPVAAAVQAKALDRASFLAHSLGDFDRAEALCRESVTLYRALGDQQGLAWTLYNLGRIVWKQGDLTAGRTLLEEGLALAKAVGDTNLAASDLHALGGLAFDQVEYARAQLLGEESLALFKAVHNQKDMTEALDSLTPSSLSKEETGTARTLAEEYRALAIELHSESAIGRALCFLGRVAQGQGDYARARSLFEEALEHYREGGHQLMMTYTLVDLAGLAAAASDFATARRLYEEGLGWFQKAKRDWEISPYEGLAGVAVVQGQAAWAARMLGAAQALRESFGMRMEPIERATYERTVVAVRTQLGDQTFTAAWAEGRTMTPEQVLAAQGEMTMSEPVPTAKPSPPPTYPNDLTEREVEVLRLLAQGLTNAQLAEQLILSPYTVHAHLRSIFSKLGVTSRSAATRFAFEHQLV